jgi:hypothetical protein
VRRPKPDKPKSTAAGGKKKTASADDDGLAEAIGSMSVGSNTRPATVSEPPALKSPPVPESDTFSKTMITVPAVLHLWDRVQGFFVEEGEIEARVLQRTDEPFCFFLTAWSAENGQMLAHRIVPGLMQRWAPAVWALTWNHTGSSGDQTSWCFKFQSQVGFDSFQTEFTKRLWETLNRISWEKIKVSKGGRSEVMILTFCAGRRAVLCSKFKCGGC